MGPAAGGTTVIITGTGFKGLHGPSAVRFGPANAASYTVNSPTQITAVTPRDPGVYAGVTVTNAGGTSNQAHYQYVAVPSIRVMYPKAGPLAGGVRVQIFGQGFSGASGPSAVTFGGVDASGFEVVGDGLINAWPPAHTEGKVDVVVTSAGGTSVSSGTGDDYTYVGAPTITSIEPAFGPEAGGTDVVITGTNFVSGDSVPMAAFGGRTAGGVVYSSTRMISDAPPHAAGTVDVVVSAAGGSSDPTGTADDFTYKVAPTVTALVPASGPTAGGTEVTITGTGFTDVSGPAGVTFGGGNAADYTVQSPTEISAVTPAHAAGTFDVVVTSGGIQSDTTGTGNDFTFIAPLPALSALDPQSGPTAGGMIVVITGNNFTGLSGASAVTFGGTNASSYVVDSSTQITAVAPAHVAGTVDVVVTTAAGSSPTAGTGNDFTYVAPTRFEQLDPHISYSAGWSLYPAPPTVGLASGGNYSRASANTSSATIYFVGERLEWIAMKGTSTGKAYVQLDSEPQQLVDLANPAGAIYKANVWNTGAKEKGLHKVKIWWYPQNLTGKYITLDAVDVVGHLVSAPPTITSVSPAMGSTDGGNSVVITGTGFTEVTKATFDGTDATSFTVDSPTKITAAAPPHSQGTVRVQVTTEGGTTEDKPSDDYTYIEIAVPTITALSPASGPTAGGTSVVITGTGFVGVTGTAAVTFGGVSGQELRGQLCHPDNRGLARPCCRQGAGAGHRPRGERPPTPRPTTSPTWLPRSSTSSRAPPSSTPAPGPPSTPPRPPRAATSAPTPRAPRSTIPFNGTRLDWIALRSTSQGKADFYVDGVLVTDPLAPLDLYGATAYQKTIFSTGELPAGYHTVKIQRSALSAVGKYLNIDAALIYGTLTAKTLLQQTDSHLLWTPDFATWTTGTSSYLSGSSYKYINKTGSVTIKFTGVSLDILAKKAASYGIMNVTLDSGTAVPVSLYRSTTAYKQTV